jgi:2-methylcitrate dehydratase PrpD
MNIMAEQLDGKAVVAALAENVLKTRFEDIDPAIIDNTRKRVLDVIGCAIGGAAAPGNDALIALVKGWGGKKEATVLAYGIKAPAQDAAWVNAILCRSFDWEPLVAIINGKRYPGHISGTTVATAVTLAESQGVSGKELITALIVGDDVAERVYAAAAEPWKRSEAGSHGLSKSPTFDAWGTMPAFGAAAIAGRLLGLNLVQLKNAFGIVINMISGAGGGLSAGATTFKLSQGTSARSGVLAAQLAKAGWTGIPDPFFGQNGYYNNFTPGCENPEVLIKDLGRKYYVELVFKPYPGGRPTHSTIDAALNLVRNHDFKTDDIEKVTVRLSPPMRYAHYMKPYKVGDYPTGDALFSYRYATATALVRKSVTAVNFTENAIRDPKVQALIKKIELAPDLEKDNGLETVVTLKDGRAFTEYVHEATGEIPHPLSWDSLASKFMVQVDLSQTVSRENAEKIITLAGKLENIANVKSIVKLAVKQKPGSH